MNGTIQRTAQAYAQKGPDASSNGSFSHILRDEPDTMAVRAIVDMDVTSSKGYSDAKAEARDDSSNPLLSPCTY